MSRMMRCQRGQGHVDHTFRFLQLRLLRRLQRDRRSLSVHARLRHLLRSTTPTRRVEASSGLSTDRTHRAGKRTPRRGFFRSKVTSESGASLKRNSNSKRSILRSVTIRSLTIYVVRTITDNDTRCKTHAELLKLNEQHAPTLSLSIQTPKHRMQK